MKENNSATNQALIGKDGLPIPYGAIVRFTTKPESVYGTQVEIGKVTQFENGELAFQHIQKLIHFKWRAIEKEAVDFSTVECIESIPLDFFISEFVDRLEEEYKNRHKKI